MSSSLYTKSLYPHVDLSNPEAISSSSSTSPSSSLYPSISMKDLTQNLFPVQEEEVRDAVLHTPDIQPQPHEETLITIPGSIVHLIETDHSVQLASGDLTIVSLKHGNTVIAVLARVGDDIQWPLAKDEATVKLDHSHYFFTLRVPARNEDQEEEEEEEEEEGALKKADVELLNYGVTIASKGQEGVLKEFDKILESFSCFTVQEVNNERGKWDVIDGNTARGISPEEMKEEENKKELMEQSSAAYWTVLAPNVEDYSGSVARMIAAGSGQLIKGILWCGDVTVDRLKWGNEFLKKRMGKKTDMEISPTAIRRIKRSGF